MAILRSPKASPNALLGRARILRKILPCGVMRTIRRSMLLSVKWRRVMTSTRTRSAVYSHAPVILRPLQSRSCRSRRLNSSAISMYIGQASWMRSVFAQACAYGARIRPCCDALTTLAFDYPPAPNRLERARLFRQNLEDFLVWTRDIGLDPTRVLGSYAGAIGMPQFMPSNILQYARSDEPNRPPELTGAADSILSIAHYLRRYGWEAGRPVVWNIGVDSGSQRIAQATADGRPEPHHTLGQLLQAGLLLNKAFLDLRAELDTPVTVVDLPTPGQPVEYWLGLCNFYILTRYNKSFFYAAAVYQLSQRLKQRFKPAMTQNLFKSSQNS